MIETIRAAWATAPPRFEASLGMRLQELEPGTATFALEAGPLNHNPMGTVHGGAVSTLADSVMGVAVATTLEDGESFTTLQLSVNFLRPATGGFLT